MHMADLPLLPRRKRSPFEQRHATFAWPRRRITAAFVSVRIGDLTSSPICACSWERHRHTGTHISSMAALAMGQLLTALNVEPRNTLARAVTVNEVSAWHTSLVQQRMAKAPSRALSGRRGGGVRWSRESRSKHPGN